MVDFDDLATQSFAEDATVEDQNELWGHVFSLEEWYFIARGEAPNLYPFIGINKQVANGQPMIRAFTDQDRLFEFAKEYDLLDASGSAPALTVAVKDIMPFLAQFEQDVYGIWFNSDPTSVGFLSPLQQLPRIKQFLEESRWEPKTIDNESDNQA